MFKKLLLSVILCLYYEFNFYIFHNLSVNVCISGDSSPFYGYKSRYFTHIDSVVYRL